MGFTGLAEREEALWLPGSPEVPTLCEIPGDASGMSFHSPPRSSAPVFPPAPLRIQGDERNTTRQGRGILVYIFLIIQIDSNHVASIMVNPSFMVPLSGGHPPP